ncbi:MULTISPECIES: cytochrome c biogenesis heme-transporting ATPase CcmA [Nitrincola]|uniref:Cytochrome c biogenesis ATP-binding export protein CcmA n=1 Tax=Nitrincola nitratireducens TaxID=1229521 RepID=W9V5H9_9GAMM|nr:MULTISPECIES: cytochrome c biogenesis heme-transporting ATPase CcmA [Nitrincola]EXJ12186.1 Cytochrome c biogenesis ATP-binding export protein CcmA [Nitrincola nitratireducens]
MSEPLLIVKNLFCERDDRVLFDQLSFDVSAGDVVQIEGQNGSGKTTLLRILGALSRHYEGDIYWKGTSIHDDSLTYRNDLLYLGHQPGVKAVLTPEENLRWFMALHPSLDVGQIRHALTEVGLRGFEDVPCHMLSAGQNRRVGLARLYLSQALLWILDEPFTAIDKQGVAAQEALLLAHAERGGAVILTTHHELNLGQFVRRVNLDKQVGTK